MSEVKQEDTNKKLINAFTENVQQHSPINAISLTLITLSHLLEKSGNDNPDFMALVYANVASLNSGLKIEELHEAVELTRMTKPSPALSVVGEK